jgi:hypothetical protein
MDTGLLVTIVIIAMSIGFACGVVTYLLIDEHAEAMAKVKVRA